MDKVGEISGKDGHTPMRYVLNWGERSERDLRESLKMASKTAEGFPAEKERVRWGR